MEGFTSKVWGITPLAGGWAGRMVVAHGAIDVPGIDIGASGDCASSQPERSRLSGRVLGMRGGLGKTLLLAFLLLTIIPLSLLAFLTYNQIQHDTRDKLLSSLSTVVALKEAHLADWIDAHKGQLALVAQEFDPATGMASWFEAMEEGGSALIGVVLVDLMGDGTHPALSVVDQVGQVPAHAGDAAVLAASRLVAAGAMGEGLVWVEGHLPETVREYPRVLGSDSGSPELLPAVCHLGERWALLGLLSPEALRQVVGRGYSAEGIVTSLVACGPVLSVSSPVEGIEGGQGSDVVVVSSAGITSLGPGQERDEAIGRVLAGEQGAGAYKDLAGQEVFGAYRWSAELGVGLLAEKRQVEALAAGEEVTALLVAATLGAALLSAAIAAVVTRRVTRPIVELTETAAWLARGDLNQQVVVRRGDEIGVLARAFNRMAAELRLLYGSLEAKVEERTQAWREANEALEEANEYTRYYVMQLAISAEVARIATSIRDLGMMLETVVELIGRAFELHYVAIYLVDATGNWAVWQVGASADEAGIEPMEHWVAVGGPTLVGRAACRPAHPTLRDDSSPLLFSLDGESEGGRPGTRIEKVVRPDGGWELAIPLCVRGEVLGVLVLESSWDGEKAPEGYSGPPERELGAGTGAMRPTGWVPESDWVVYQSLADQISIAIENARAYALERETVERLRELDRIQAEFLTNMSHALRTPLNSVIGFSRVMLKELDGPLSDMQRADLTTIYEAGRQLLGLLNDMLDLSQLEMGAASWSEGEVDLAEVIEGVMATTRALAMNKPLQLRAQVAEDLPPLYTDGQRVRQVILALLSNSVKFTEVGTITLRADLNPGGRSMEPEGAVPSTPRPGHSDEVALSVTIEGTGSEAGLASVWEQGVSAAGNGQEAPAGFGLAVSKRVVEKLGGKIWLDRGAEGMVFTLTLPVQWPSEPPLVARRASIQNR
ncbi:MAG: HAMP domain-containing protein [Anaerolineae bacterium]|nr:HAMP domain-containing protein [Anaerolineae bacterium]